MTSPLSAAAMNIAINEIDESLDQMTSVLLEEVQNLHQSFDTYLQRIGRNRGELSAPLYAKLIRASSVFERAKNDTSLLMELVELLKRVKQVNKMVRFALTSNEEVFMNITAYMDSISNVCLGQIKEVKKRYQKILHVIKVEITRLWLDREIAEKLRLILSVNHILFDKFRKAFHRAEILYADFSISIERNRKDDNFHQWIVLRMISNRLHSSEEQSLIDSLFPKWNSAPLTNK